MAREIMVYLLKTTSEPYSRGLLKSVGARTVKADEQEMRYSSAVQELNAFIRQRHPLKTKVALRFGRPSPHSPAMQALYDQIED